MLLVSFNNVSIAFGLDNLLESANLQINAGERVGLIGRNGAGKSTLLKLVDGAIQPDAGEILLKPGLRVARLDQELPSADSQTVFDAVARGLDQAGRWLAEYHQVAQAVTREFSPERLKRMEWLHQQLDAHEGWALEQRVETVMTRLQLPADSTLAELSGGWRRRVDLGRVLVGDPDLLLLDEPTNHLDIETIQWLEDQLLEYRGGLLFVTHDRALLQRLATRILELDRGRLSAWSCSYQEFLGRKAAALEEEARQNAKFDKLLAQEEIWIRQGIKARRTRNEGRVRALEALREERRRRREQVGNPGFDLLEAARSGELVIEADNVSYSWDSSALIRDFSIRILRGDRIGLIGSNGSGKSSLLQILLGQIEPDAGGVRQGTRLQIAYFDQLRNAIDLDLSVLDNVAEGRERVMLNGRERHIISYLADFLFTPERARTPAKALSGGERNRLLLARLFSQPANLLVMDEPTNDLDMETLGLLEELLLGFQGTLLLVSHDRVFLDNVVTSCLVFEGQGRIQEFVGGYSDWMRRGGRFSRPGTDTAPVSNKPAPAALETKPRRPHPRTKLSYKERRELEQLPVLIETLEAEQSQLQQLTADPDLYRRNPDELTQIMAGLKELEEKVNLAYLRWGELENLQGGSE
jgi:ATP-binding cassette subfamily F protein uup